MISSVTNQGKARWMIVDKAFDAGKLIEFVAALIGDTDKKVFLILDNLRVHHSRKVKAWLAERPGKIELFWPAQLQPRTQPRRTPERRPQASSAPPRARTKARLMAVTTEHMSLIESSPDRVMAYFQDPNVRYAA